MCFFPFDCEILTTAVETIPGRFWEKHFASSVLSMFFIFTLEAILLEEKTNKNNLFLCLPHYTVFFSPRFPNKFSPSPKRLVGNIKKGINSVGFVLGFLYELPLT